MDLIGSYVFGFLFSWAIGLSPALIYRYVIIKKPIQAKKVFWRLAPIVAVLCILYKYMVAMTNNGVYNPNPIPWFFIYWGGHWIMTRPVKKRGIAGKPHGVAPSTGIGHGGSGTTFKHPMEVNGLKVQPVFKQEPCQKLPEAYEEASFVENQEQPMPLSKQDAVPHERTISCPGCVAINERGARFCGECGHALWRQCPECGAEDSSAKRFCTACGTDIEGFLGAQQMAGRMQEHAKMQEWGRVLQEADGFKEDARLPGEKGAGLRAAIASHVRHAANAMESNIWANLVAVHDPQLAPLRGTYLHLIMKFFGGHREETRPFALAEGSKEAQEAQKAAVAETGLPLEVKSKVSGIAFRLVPAGEFTMGSPAAGRLYDETQHPVVIGKPFYCGKHPVTQAQWERAMGSNPSHFKDSGKDGPVESVSWEDCQAFLKKLCELEGVPQGTYRLLTEAQWEYACRAGTTGRFAGDLDAMGWHYLNSGVKSHPVGQKHPNAWGLHDMHGNVREWCSDWYGNYQAASAVDPAGPSSGTCRICRGGSWNDLARCCRSAFRGSGTPGFRSFTLGLRIQLVVPEKGQEKEAGRFDLCPSTDPAAWA